RCAPVGLDVDHTRSAAGAILFDRDLPLLRLALRLLAAAVCLARLCRDLNWPLPLFFATVATLLCLLGSFDDVLSGPANPGRLRLASVAPIGGFGNGVCLLRSINRDFSQRRQCSACVGCEREADVTGIVR